MDTSRIDHIGVVVKDAGERLRLYRDFLGLELMKVEELPERGLRVYFLKVGDTRIELLEPMHENSEVSAFLEKRGEGVHHIAFNVHGIDDAIELAKRHGLQPLSDTPQRGAGGTKVLFFHPKTTGGVLVELVEGEH